MNFVWNCRECGSGAGKRRPDVQRRRRQGAAADSAPDVAEGADVVVPQELRGHSGRDERIGRRKVGGGRRRPLAASARACLHDAVAERAPDDARPPPPPPTQDVRGVQDVGDVGHQPQFHVPAVVLLADDQRGQGRIGVGAVGVGARPGAQQRADGHQEPGSHPAV